MDLPAWREENLAKRPEENDKKLRMSLVQIREREKSLKSFWNVNLNKSNSVFKKLDSRFSIDRKSALIDQNRQRLIKKIFESISIDWKTALISWNSRKIKVLKKQPSFCIKSSMHWKIWVKCMSMRCKVFQKHKF